MKAFIERVFMAKKNKKEELLNEEVVDQTTEAAVEAIVEEVKKSNKVEVQHTDTKAD